MKASSKNLSLYIYIIVHGAAYAEAGSGAKRATVVGEQNT